MSQINETTNLYISFKIFSINFPTWPILFLSVFAFVGFIGNLLVCLAIRIDPKLQTATNYYLFSLACTDLLVSILVIPLSIQKSYFNNWILDKQACLLFVFLDVFLCNTSILQLCIISCERYIGIRNPLKTREKSKSKTKLIIFLTWLVSFLLSSPIILLAYYDTTNILQYGTCALYNKHFVIYGSILSFIIPLIIMIIMYIQTVRRLRKVLKEFRIRTDQKGDQSPMKLNRTQLSVKFKEPSSESSSLRGNSFKSMIKNKSIVTVLSNESTDTKLETPKFRSIVQKHRLINRTLCALQINRESTAVKNEEKAVKVLGIVFVIFVIAWLPFAVFNILSAICPQCSIHPSLLNVLTWFGYVSSSINPLIYNAFNERFRIAFKQILMCQLKALRKSSFKQSNRMLFKMASEKNNSRSRYSYMNKVRNCQESN